MLETRCLMRWNNPILLSPIAVTDKNGKTSAVRTAGSAAKGGGMDLLFSVQTFETTPNAAELSHRTPYQRLKIPPPNANGVGLRCSPQMFETPQNAAE